MDLREDLLKLRTDDHLRNVAIDVAKRVNLHQSAMDLHLMSIVIPIVLRQKEIRIKIVVVSHFNYVALFRKKHHKYAKKYIPALNIA